MASFTYRYPGLASVLRVPVTFVSGGRKVEAAAVWDTGAMTTCISDEVAKALNLYKTGYITIRSATQCTMVPTYLIDIVLPNKIGYTDVRVCGLPGSCLIGMDLISGGDLAISGAGGKTTFSFRSPAVKESDYSQ